MLKRVNHRSSYQTRLFHLLEYLNLHTHIHDMAILRSPAVGPSRRFMVSESEDEDIDQRATKRRRTPSSASDGMGRGGHDYARYDTNWEYDQSDQDLDEFDSDNMVEETIPTTQYLDGDDEDDRESFYDSPQRESDVLNNGHEWREYSEAPVQAKMEHYAVEISKDETIEEVSESEEGRSVEGQSEKGHMINGNGKLDHGSESGEDSGTKSPSPVGLRFRSEYERDKDGYVATSSLPSVDERLMSASLLGVSSESSAKGS